jgi:glycosyltransferase involved in cell wall biosynthesis
VGTLFDWCGLDLLIEALAEIKEEMRPKLVIVGDGISRRLFEEKVKKKGVDEYVKFIGKQPWEEIPSLIAGFDFCYSGQIETKSGKMYHSPLKIYEYLSMGKPVIASAYADAKSTILDGKNGFLFIPGDKEDLIHVIHRSISSWKSGDFKMQEIRTRLKNEHSWDQRIEFLLEQLKGSL